MREIDLCKENPKLFEPSSDLITPEEYEKMPPEVRAKVLSMPPGARHLALPPLPVDFEAMCKTLIPKLEAIPQVESLWIYEDNPITPSFWWVAKTASYKLDKKFVQLIVEMMNLFPRNHIDYHWVTRIEPDEEGLIPDRFIKKWERKACFRK